MIYFVQIIIHLKPFELILFQKKHYLLLFCLISFVRKIWVDLSHQLLFFYSGLWIFYLSKMKINCNDYKLVYLLFRFFLILSDFVIVVSLRLCLNIYWIIGSFCTFWRLRRLCFCLLVGVCFARLGALLLARFDKCMFESLSCFRFIVNCRV